MDITFLAPCKDLSGGLKVISVYGNKLLERGHNVTIIFPKKQQRLVQRLRDLANHKPDHLDHFNGRLLAVKTITDNTVPDADILIATAWETAEWAAGLSESKGSRFYLIQGYETWAGSRKRVHQTYGLPFKKITISNWLQKKVEMISGDANIEIIPNASDFSIETPEAEPHKRTYHVGMTYSPIPNKGCDTGISALWKLKAEHPWLKFVIFGSEAPMQKLPPDTDVFVKPAQEKIGSLYQDTSIWLSTSFEEGFCLPALEAMSCGAVIVASDSKGVRDIVDHEYDGFLVTPGDPDELTEKAGLFIKSPYLMKVFHRRGIDKSKTFDWDSSADKLDAILAGDTFKQVA